jgi:hypothetical protein
MGTVKAFSSGYAPRIEALAQKLIRRPPLLSSRTKLMGDLEEKNNQNYSAGAGMDSLLLNLVLTTVFRHRTKKFATKNHNITAISKSSLDQILRWSLSSALT